MILTNYITHIFLHVIYITHIIYISHIIYTAHILKFIFKLDNKLFSIKVLVYITMVNGYYKKHKERFQKEAHERYQNIFEEEKDKKQKEFRDR